MGVIALYFSDVVRLGAAEVRTLQMQFIVDLHILAVALRSATVRVVAVVVRTS